MATNAPFFQLDTTGTDPANRRESEEYIVANTTFGTRALSIEMGCFFTESFILYDSERGILLTKGEDYVFTEVYTSLSIIYGKEIAATVIITNPLVGQVVEATYQFLGSQFKDTLKTAAITVNQQANQRQISSLQWNALNDANTFIPSDYARQIGAGVGIENVVFGLERIRSAIIYNEFNLDITLGDYIGEFLNNLVDALENLSNTEYKQVLEEFIEKFSKEFLGIEKFENLPVVNPEVAKYAVIRNYQFDKSIDGYITIKGLSKFKEELYNNLVSSSKTGIGRYYGVYGLPLLDTMYSMANGAGIIIDSLEVAKVSGYSFNEVVYPDKVSPSDRWSIVKVTNNKSGQGGVFWGSNITTGELYIGYLDNSVNASNVLEWTKLYGEYDIQKAIKALTDHENDFDNPHKVTKHQLDLGNVENLSLATSEDLACRTPSKKYVSHKFLLAFMSTYMSGLKTAEDLKEMNCDENEVIRNIKLIFAPCGPCGPCCEPNIIPVVSTTPPPFNIDEAGKLTGWFCDGGKRWDIITDGFGGTFNKEHIYAEDSPDIVLDGCKGITSQAPTTTSTQPPVDPTDPIDPVDPEYSTTSTSLPPVLEYWFIDSDVNQIRAGGSVKFKVRTPLGEDLLVETDLIDIDDNRVSANYFTSSINNSYMMLDNTELVFTTFISPAFHQNVKNFRLVIFSGDGQRTMLARSDIIEVIV